MNKQDKGSGRRGIEWTDYTWNPIGGCLHGCAWEMPGGKIANCYAEDVAQGIASPAYPQGFEHHYWKPQLLDEPLRLQEPSKIFCGSMADVFGHWVSDDQIEAVLDVCRKAHWHTFQFLTKAAPRLLKFSPFPSNVWVGVSAPPTFFMGKRMTLGQTDAYWRVATRVFSKIEASVRWFSLEPLTHYNPYLEEANIQWAVIGAASEGKRYIQPDRTVLQLTLDTLEQRKIPTFFKGNMRPSLGAAFDEWREEFPPQPEMHLP